MLSVAIIAAAGEQAPPCVQWHQALLKQPLRQRHPPLLPLPVLMQLLVAWHAAAQIKDLSEAEAQREQWQLI